MVTLSKAQVGARRYLGSRLSPNQGPVSAKGQMGYVKRSLRNKRPVVTPYGKDEESDRRSGAARRMLMQQQAALGKTLQSQTKFSNDQQLTKDKFQQAYQAQQAQQAPEVKAGANGQLELPYNHEFSTAQWQAINQANEKALGLKMEGDQQALEYTRAKREAEKGYGQLTRQTLNNNAARGTAFSSMYGTAVAQNAGAFADHVGSLEAENTAFNQNLALQRAAIQNSLNQELGLNTLDYANELGGQAGTLGYGKAKQKVNKNHKNRSNLKGPKGRKKKLKPPSNANVKYTRSPLKQRRIEAAKNALKKKTGQKHLTKGQRARIKKKVSRRG